MSSIRKILLSTQEFIQKVNEVTTSDGIQWEKRFRMIYEPTKTNSVRAIYNKIVYINGHDVLGKADERYLDIRGCDERLCGRILPFAKDLDTYKTFISSKDGEIMKRFLTSLQL